MVTRRGFARLPLADQRFASVPGADHAATSPRASPRGRGGMVLALPGVAAVKLGVKGAEDAGLVETPGRADEIVGRGVATDPLDDHLGRQLLQEIDQHGDVVVATKERDLAPLDLIGQGSVFDGVEIVDFDRVELEAGQFAGGREHVGVRLAREAEDHVAADFKTAAPAAVDCVQRSAVMMTAIHPVERTVVDRLNAIFDGQIRAAGEFLEQIEYFVGHAVGPGADRQADDFRMGESLLVERAETLDRGVGVGRGLEIGDEPLDVIAPLEAADAIVELAADPEARQAAAGAEAAVVAKGAATDGDGSIDVGTGEAGIEADFLDAAAELLPEEVVEAVVAQTGRPPGGKGGSGGECGGSHVTEVGSRRTVVRGRIDNEEESKLEAQSRTRTTTRTRTLPLPGTLTAGYPSGRVFIGIRPEARQNSELAQLCRCRSIIGRAHGSLKGLVHGELRSAGTTWRR